MNHECCVTIYISPVLFPLLFGLLTCHNAMFLFSSHVCCIYLLYCKIYEKDQNILTKNEFVFFFLIKKVTSMQLFLLVAPMLPLLQITDETNKQRLLVFKSLKTKDLSCTHRVTWSLYANGIGLDVATNIRDLLVWTSEECS